MHPLIESKGAAPQPDIRATLRLLPAPELRDAIAAEGLPSRFHVLQDLIDLAHEQLDCHPARALEIMDTVMPFVDQVEIPAEASASRLGFHAGALKVYAHALTPTQPRKAEQTIREAIRLAEEGDDLRLNATLQLVLALVLDANEESPRALAVTRTAIPVFEEAGDHAMLLTARQIEASILMSLRRVDEAQEIYLSAMTEARRQGDTTSETRILNNLGCVSASRGYQAEAYGYFAAASPRFRDLGMEVEATRVRWGATRIAQSAEQYTEALAEMEAVRVELVAAGCPRDAVIASLEVAGILTLLGRGAEARILCLDAADWFRSAGFPLLTAQALEQLRAAWAVTDERIAEERSVPSRKTRSRIVNEDAETEKELGRLLDSGYLFEYASIYRQKRFRTSNVVRRLCRAAREKGGSEPLFALGLAEVAVKIAERLTFEDGREWTFPEARGMAWVEYAAACRSLDQLEDSLRALALAERAYRGLPSVLLDPASVDLGVHAAINMTSTETSAEALPTDAAGLAGVDLGRAVVYWSQERWAEALSSVRSAARRFVAHSDAAGLFEAKQIEALILGRTGDPDAACTVHEMMLTFAKTMNDQELEARAAQNLGMARAGSGDHEAARALFVTTATTFKRLGMEAAAAQARAGIARAALAEGRSDEAITLFRAVAADLERLALPVDVALAKLDLAEALLQSRRHEPLKQLCASLVTFFGFETTLIGAIAAAELLADQAQAGTITREDIESVRACLAGLGRDRYE
jgi:tetratricopeptide (TPR) repeat protein